MLFVLRTRQKILPMKIATINHIYDTLRRLYAEGGWREEEIWKIASVQGSRMD